jgi:1,4-alpha-glucan branching enzyme
LIEAEDLPWSRRAQSAEIYLPPLAVVMFAPKSGARRGK